MITLEHDTLRKSQAATRHKCESCHKRQATHRLLDGCFEWHLCPACAKAWRRFAAGKADRW